MGRYIASILIIVSIISGIIWLIFKWKYCPYNPWPSPEPTMEDFLIDMWGLWSLVGFIFGLIGGCFEEPDTARQMGSDTNYKWDWGEDSSRDKS